MKKPTKRQRHAIYKKALIGFDRCPSSLCGIIYADGGGSKHAEAPVMVPEYFPEFAAQRPRNAGIYWWGSTKASFAARRRALVRCIELSKS